MWCRARPASSASPARWRTNCAGQVRANTVTPGLMQAPRPAGQPEPQHHSFSKPLVGRRGLPEDISEIVRFLAGPKAAYITGQNYQLNGGAYLS